jgi:hypothetical protein
MAELGPPARIESRQLSVFEIFGHNYFALVDANGNVISEIHGWKTETGQLSTYEIDRVTGKVIKDGVMLPSGRAKNFIDTVAKQPEVEGAEVEIPLDGQPVAAGPENHRSLRQPGGAGRPIAGTSVTRRNFRLATCFHPVFLNHRREREHHEHSHFSQPYR